MLIYVLMERQSSDDRSVALRLLGYMVKICDEYRRTHERATHLPAILPLVACHDDAGWHAPCAFAGVVGVPAEMAEVLAPQMLRDCGGRSGACKERGAVGRAMSELGRATLFVPKRARQSPDVTAELLPYIGLLREVARSEHGLAALGAILRYILAVNEGWPQACIRRRPARSNPGMLGSRAA